MTGTNERRVVNDSTEVVVHDADDDQLRDMIIRGGVRIMTTLRRQASWYAVTGPPSSYGSHLTAVRPRSFFRFDPRRLHELQGLLASLRQLGGRLQALSLYGEQGVRPDGVPPVDAVAPDPLDGPVVLPSLRRVCNAGGEMESGTNIQSLSLRVSGPSEERVANTILHDLRRQLVTLEVGCGWCAPPLVVWWDGFNRLQTLLLSGPLDRGG
ncbi:hypothetical protein HK101_005854, partial [Irineochytrium annulatum]